jgi:hypothetical protein
MLIVANIKAQSSILLTAGGDSTVADGDNTAADAMVAVICRLLYTVAFTSRVLNAGRQK